MFNPLALRPASRRGPFFYRLACRQCCRHFCNGSPSVSGLVRSPLIRIESGSFYRQYPTENDAAQGTNPPLFKNLNFILPCRPVALSINARKRHPPQHWAVIGSSGRTELLNVLRGQYVCVPPNARSYPYLLTKEIRVKNYRLQNVANAIHYIGFSGEGSGAIGGTRGAYLSARYESLREETDWTVGQFLRGQMSLNPAEGEEGGTVEDEAHFDQVVADLHLGSLLDMPVANLSNGQTRRARIAKALLKKPELLLLDEPFMGLDPATVRSLSSLLHGLAEKRSPRLILGLRPQDKVPDWINHLMILGYSNRVLLQGERSEVEAELDVWKYLRHSQLPEFSGKESEMYAKGERYLNGGFMDKRLLQDLGVVSQRHHRLAPRQVQDGEPVIEMDGVRVQYGDKVVLGNWKQKVGDETKEGLHWTVRRGQRWAIIGPNGSGKTTLLSLITSDHPQAYALPIRLFGRSRLPEPGKPAVSLFELQSRLGHSSPEIHAFFPRQLTIRQSLESAFAETFLARPKLNHSRDSDISAILHFFKTELDPDASFTANADEPPPPPQVPLSNPSLFPKLSNAGLKSYSLPDATVEYADSTTFGSLSTAQQRLVLFLRALVHRPDIVILDEPFSGMPATMRDKAIRFLETGETKNLGRPSHTEAVYNENCRWKGLGADQALIVISHVQEEIPNIVRNFIRLPSSVPDIVNSGDRPAAAASASAADGGGGKKGQQQQQEEEEGEEVVDDDDEELDFRIGTLRATRVFSNPQCWDAVWSPRTAFENHVRVVRNKLNAGRRGSDNRVKREFGIKEAGETSDEKVFHWDIL